MSWFRGLLPANSVKGPNLLWALFLVSFATLYVEIMLIRWVGTEIRIFAFVQNLALIACFLGFGLGCFWCDRRKNLHMGLWAMAALVLLTHAPIRLWQTLLFNLSNLLSLSPDAALWGYTWEMDLGSRIILFIVSVVVMGAILLLLVAAMLPLGQWVGYYLNKAEHPVTAYSVNLLGSVAGLWAFAGMAFLWLSPEYWIVVAFLAFLVIRRPEGRTVVLAVVLLAGCLVILRLAATGPDQVYWSPYQKLSVQTLGSQEYRVLVNNTSYMTIANRTPEFLAQDPELAGEFRALNSYDTPFRFVERKDRVLIVGAGAGNDAAAALRNGASRVDAVEIDPVIRHLGQSLHPEDPYGSDRVRTVINDARAFMRQTKEQYDVILFGLLDSHTQFSNHSNMRLDNFVYTEESFREALRLLKDSGVLIVKFEVRPPWTWMGDRFYSMIERLFGRPPVVFYAPPQANMASATVFIASKDSAMWERAEQPELKSLVEQNPPKFAIPVGDNPPPPTTDDWPYVYHRGRSIPRTYYTVSLILLAIAAFLVRRVFEPRRVSTWHFFFLGAGFLLLETQLISRLALYFGTTWIVNCVAISAILLMLVLANVYVTRWPPGRLGPFYIPLVVSLVAVYFVPWQAFPFSARTIGVILAGAYSVPVFFAGVIFTESFRRSEVRSGAFGANILGSVAGGLAQNVSFIVGLNALLLLAAACYGTTALLGLLGTRTAPGQEAAV